MQGARRNSGRALTAVVITSLIAAMTTGLTGGCGGGETTTLTAFQAESCMQCHNASPGNDYGGPGIENPHPFPGADNLLCTTCHGGHPNEDTQGLAHIPAPPEIGDRDQWDTNAYSYFNRLTLTGLDKLPDYTANGKTYTALDYLQFINPGDLRVVAEGRACGACHAGHVEDVLGSPLATAAGMFSGGTFAVGADGQVPATDGLYEDTASDLAFRAVHDPDFNLGSADVGEVSELLEFPVYSVRNNNDIKNNPAYLAAALFDDVEADGQVVTDSPLARLYHEQLAFTCGDCHLGSAGANNRAGDYRSSGCSACHMPYSLSGRSGSSDPNINKLEPLDPDDIDDPELSHPRSHRIVSVAKSLPNGHSVEGMDDMTCAGCHQGSNRTVMQYWGIRLDQNQDVRFGNQYPSNPATWQGTHNDQRLFPDEVNNHTFNGRNGNQYLAKEDYDNDGRDDTPQDVHAEAGMGCIDCHGSSDLHGGDVTAPGRDLVSRMEQATSISCESCHGTLDAYATTVASTDLDGNPAQVAVDEAGKPLRHVVQQGDGSFRLRSKLTGDIHYLPQTRDVAVDTGVQYPGTTIALFSQFASYAMGRANGTATDGIGPRQTGGVTSDFCHSDTMDCASCHASWTNTCMGCHLVGEFNGGNNFSNITGERIDFREDDALFVYQSPLFFQLGIGTDNKITQFSSNTKMFFSYEDQQNDLSDVFAFSDRNGKGANAVSGLPSMSHNAMMAHSIRGKVSPTNEGPQNCASCHLTDQGVADFGGVYDTFRTAMATGDYASLDFATLKAHFGDNTQNWRNSPLWVHMVAGLGSGLFLFDENGYPVNDIDEHDKRIYNNGTQSPKDVFDIANARYDLDRLVTPGGLSTASNNHPMEGPTGNGGAPSVNLRDGANNPALSGPLGATLIQRLTDPSVGIVLDTWIDADGVPQGDTTNITDP